MTTPQQYESARRRQKKLNFKKFTIIEKGVSKKINSFIDLTSNIYTKKRIICEIQDNELFKWWFVKDPIRQNIYEIEVTKYIKKIPRVKNVMKPKLAIFVSNGKLVPKMRQIKDKKLGLSTSNKSVDLFWEYGNYKCYAYHKYAREGGGHQKNQKDDAESFIIACKSNKYRKKIFFAILDGNYFQIPKGRNNISIIDELKQKIITKKNVFVLPSEELKKNLWRLP